MGVQETSNAITSATERLQALMTSFNNEFGEDGSARGIKTLYDKYALSNPPTTGEYNAMSVITKSDYFIELWSVITRALAIESIYDELTSINPGAGVFGDLASVKTWALANMNKVGVEAGKDCDVLTSVRATLTPFITTTMLKSHSDAITAFRNGNTTQIGNLGTG